MIPRFWPAAAMAGLLAAPPLAAEPVHLRDGLWRMDIEMTVPGRGPDTGPMTHDLCLTPNDVVKLAVPPNSPCKVTSLDIQVRRMHWKVQCEQGPARTRGEGTMEFGGDRFAGVMATFTEPYGIKITQKMTGKYLGACPLPKSVRRAPEGAAAGPAGDAAATPALPRYAE